MSCNGHCQDDEVTLELNRWGDGKYCEDGNEVYCCDSPGAKENKCYWAGVIKSCNGDDDTMVRSVKHSKRSHTNAGANRLSRAPSLTPSSTLPNLLLSAAVLSSVL
jgi:hypothetical protein